LEFGTVGFCGEKTEEPGEKPLRKRRELTTNMMPGVGIKPGPHWWEAQPFTTAPPLLPSVNK